MLAQTPAAGTEVAKDSTVTLTVAKAPPQVEVPDVLGEDVDDARQAGRGGRFPRDAARADGRLARGRRRRDHAEPAVGREARQGVDGDADRRPASSRRTRKPSATPTPSPHAVRVAVLAGGRSSEHDVSMDSAATVGEALRRGRPRGRGGAAGARRLVDGAATARRWRSRPAAACSAPTSSSRCCTGRSARTARSRGCWSCSTSPTWAPACSPPRCAWTRSSSRRCWPPPGVPQVAYAAVREDEWRADAGAVRARVGALGLPVFVKPARLGSSVGISKVVDGGRARRGAGDGLRATTGS